MRRGKESNQIPGGTAPVNEFLNSPKGKNLIERIAYLLWQIRGYGSNQSENYQDAEVVATQGLCRQLARHRGIIFRRH